MLFSKALLPLFALAIFLSACSTNPVAPSKSDQLDAASTAQGSSNDTINAVFQEGENGATAAVSQEGENGATAAAPQEGENGTTAAVPQEGENGEMLNAISQEAAEQTTEQSAITAEQKTKITLYDSSNKSFFVAEVDPDSVISSYDGKSFINSVRLELVMEHRPSQYQNHDRMVILKDIALTDAYQNSARLQSPVAGWQPAEAETLTKKNIIFNRVNGQKQRLSMEFKITNYDLSAQTDPSPYYVLYFVLQDKRLALFVNNP